jgi:8-oxo-dGTP pyrophosphatase MutT (NUDIX family)
MNIMAFFTMLNNCLTSDSTEGYEKNAVLWLIIWDNKHNCWRVIMTAENRRTKNVWGLPGGNIDQADQLMASKHHISASWIAAQREFNEETEYQFHQKYYKRSTDVKFTRNNTRFYISVYEDPHIWQCKGFKKNKEINFVELPRLTKVIHSLQTGEKLTCG